MLVYFLCLFLSILLDSISSYESIYNIIFIRNLCIFLLISGLKKRIRIIYSWSNLLSGIFTFGGFFFYLQVLQAKGIYFTTLSYYLIPIFDLFFLVLNKMESVSPLRILLYLPLAIYLNEFNIFALCGALCFSYCNIIVKNSNEIEDTSSSALVTCIISSFYLSNFSNNIYLIGALGSLYNYCLVLLIRNNSFINYHMYQFLDVILLSIYFSNFNFIFYFALCFLIIGNLNKVLR